eukprot:COSAG02_NODE_6727_length_3396_cov_2.243710_1_plen_201_part_00
MSAPSPAAESRAALGLPPSPRRRQTNASVLPPAPPAPRLARLREVLLQQIRKNHERRPNSILCSDTQDSNAKLINTQESGLEWSRNPLSLCEGHAQPDAWPGAPHAPHGAPHGSTSRHVLARGATEPGVSVYIARGKKLSNGCRTAVDTVQRGACCSVLRLYTSQAAGSPCLRGRPQALNKWPFSCMNHEAELPAARNSP